MLFAVGETVGVGAGFDDGAFEGEPVHDRCAKARVGEGLRPPGEGLVGCDRHRGFLFPFSEDLEEKLGAAFVQFHVAKLINAK